VATRAGVSESDFHQVFSSVEECYRATYDEGLERLARTVAAAAAREGAWLERVRSGFVSLLGFLDDEPSWARLLLLEIPLNGALRFECEQRLHQVLARLLERDPDLADYRGARNAASSPILLATLTGELVVGGVFSVIRASMLEDDGGKLVELAPSLMAFIVAPYFGQVAAQAELEGRPSGRRAAPASEPQLTRAQAISRAAELPVRATHRTTLVLRAIGQAPYSNNREVAHAAGLADEGQTSKLLARLERQGVIENVGIGAARGEPNAWLLTGSGRRALELIDAFGARMPRGARIRGEA
jgi:AcrR family transcriptional regulator